MGVSVIRRRTMMATALAVACGVCVSPALARTQLRTKTHAVVVAAEPDAAQAGLKVLKAGGSAVDAAVAIQAVLGLEEPQSSGLGGGAFLVYYDAKTGRTRVYNGRETAPAAATPNLFMDDQGKPMGFVNAIISGRSTGVPGAVAMLAKAHAEHGKRPWASLFTDAEKLARDGFVVPGRMGAAMSTPYPMANTDDAKAYFTKPDGQRYKAGDVMTNPAYAHSLDLIAQQGPDALLKGELAQAIVARVAREAIPGKLTAQDMASYQPESADALCRPYRQYKICTTGAPAGGVGLLELLGVLERTDIARRGPKDPESWFIFAQASRLAYADRDYYEGDPDFVSVPAKGLIDPDYDAARAAQIPGVGAGPPEPGKPPGATPHGKDATAEPGGTTHFVVVDAEGDMVSMTTTVESIFGSGRMVGGFFLNNQLTDFSAPVAADGTPAANAPGPRKRPRSSMTPVIIFDAQNRPIAAIGSPGGNSIVAYVAKAIVGWVDWKLPLQDAVNLPNLVARGGVVSVEKGMDPAIVAALQAHGLPVHPDAGEASGLNGVVLHGKTFETAVDPRREGVARSY